MLDRRTNLFELEHAEAEPVPQTAIPLERERPSERSPGSTSRRRAPLMALPLVGCVAGVAAGVLLAGGAGHDRGPIHRPEHPSPPPHPRAQAGQARTTRSSHRPRRTRPHRTGATRDAATVPRVLTAGARQATTVPTQPSVAAVPPADANFVGGAPARADAASTQSKADRTVIVP